MISVKVTYTVKPGFAATNKHNIQQFMKDFKTLGNDFRYTVFEGADGKTFTHLSQYKNEMIQKKLLETPSFKSFQQQRDDSGLERQPQIEFLTTVGSSHDIF
ncbi:hypothetical protein D3H65_29960 [Paraflavitalea soli]|uniref:ABM domain-containing protein n=1 Tax=Paraflavitalea soli TaxID=2315862 RepID=A0A3B7MTW5_9BACT|nr:hypothetical protein [Paraflavitalea soli]AXY77962.1 hypothetical protein D3H65_29960 [Paraflavitalea soli]